MDNSSVRKKMTKYSSVERAAGLSKRRSSLVPSIYSVDAIESPVTSFSEIARAIETGDIEFVRRVMSKPEDQVILQDYETGMTALHCAAKFSLPILEELLSFSETRRIINSVDARGVTPLIVAIWYGNADAVRLLLERGANARTWSFENTKTSLHIAATVSDLSVVLELLKWIDDESFLNETDDEGNTALMISTESCQLEIVKALLKAGVDHTVKNPNSGRNVLHCAVIHECPEILDHLIAEFSEDVGFIGDVDSKGATALRLAVELGDDRAVFSLITSSQSKNLICNYPDVLHRLIDDEIVSEQVLRTVLQTCNKNLQFWRDESGKDILTHAVELGRVNIVRFLLQRENRLPNYKDPNGRTILHKAVLSQNVEIMNAILSAHRANELIDVVDKDGRTAFALALEHPSLDFLFAFKHLDIDDQSVNSNLETSLFVAAKEANYLAVLALLLSEPCFQLMTASVLNSRDVKRAHFKQIIFTSDVYILIGTVAQTTHKVCPNHRHLFWTNDAGQNIFHACALGGCLDCVTFVHQFCRLFHEPVLKCLDARDKAGNTPLMLAIKKTHLELVKFFILSGANVTSKNAVGLTPLRAIPKHVVDHREFLRSFMNQFIVYDSVSQKRSDDLSRLTIDFKMFLPKDTQPMKVIGEFVEEFKSPEDQKVMTHPLVEYYVTLKCSKIKTAMVTRFYVTFMHTLLLSLYLTIKFCDILGTDLNLQIVLWWLTTISAGASLLFNLPTFFVTTNVLRSVTLKILVLAPFASLMYLILFDDDKRTSLEIAGFAVLMSWHCLFAHGIASPIGRQIAIYVVVFKTVMRYSPVFFIVLLSFAFYFFTLFHDYLEFNNPIHSLIFTGLQMPEGEMTEIPILSTAQPIMGSRTDFNSVTESDGGNELDRSRETRNMLVEGSAIFFYFLCFISSVNTLLALSVHSGAEIKASGEVARLAMWTQRMEEWESFASSRLCRVMSRLGVLWLVGIPRSGVSAWRNLPTVCRPLVDSPTKYDLVKFKHFVTEKSDVITNRTPPSLLDEMTSNAAGKRTRKVRPSYTLFMDC